MALSWIDISVILAFIAFSLYIGLRFRKQAGKSLSDFFLGGRNLPWYIAGMSMVATTFAADTPLAVSEMVAQNGISRNWIWWSFLTGGMLTTFFFADLWRRANILTELEFIDIRYSGPSARFLRGFKAIYLGLFMNCMILGWVNLALNALLTAFFGIPADQVLYFTGAAMIIAMVYSSLSGLLGIAITDAVQFVVAMIGTIVLAVVVLYSEDVGGITGLKEDLPETYFQFFPSFSGNGGTDIATTAALSIGAFLSYVGIQWWASWYPGAEPGGGGYIAQRMMSTRTEKDSVLASMFFQVAHYCLRPWPWIIVGLCAISLYDPGISMKDQELKNKILELKEQGISRNEVHKHIPAAQNMEKGGAMEKAIHYSYNPRLGYVYAMRDYLPVGLRGLLLVAFLAAYMSTVSTHLNWGASYLVNDLYLPYIARGDPDQSKQVRISRLVTALIMVLALFVTGQIDSISGVWNFILECGAGLGLVLILRWYWWRINAWSEIAATVTPFVVYAIGKFYLEDVLPPGFTENRGSFFLTVGVTTITWLLVTYLTPPVTQEKLSAFHDRVKPDGAWGGVKENQEKKEQNNLTGLVICWISSVILVYSILFFTGKLILGAYGAAGIFLLAGLISGIILMRFLKRTRIFFKKEESDN